MEPDPVEPDHVERSGGPSLIQQARLGLLGAALRTSTRPHRWLQPSRMRWRVLLIMVWLALAVGLGGGAIGQLIVNMRLEPGLGWLLGLLQCGPLLVAWRWPLAAWRVMVIGLLFGLPAVLSTQPELSWPWPVTSCIALVLVLFWLAASHDRPTVLGVGALTGVVMIAPAVVFTGMSRWLGLILCGIVALVLVFGDAVGGRYAAEASLAEQAELRRADLARQAVLEERARIARELHDVVAHHMSVIAVQAEAAPYKIADLPAGARATFATIRNAAVDALGETRRVVGLLRENGEAPEREPQPGLDRLDELVERGRQAGLDVEQLVLGVPQPLAAGVDLSAYRIVQEALSNAARHAPGSRVRVEIGYQEARLRVAVSNAATTSIKQPADHTQGGHGLVGMRERVTMLGGTFAATPTPDGGFAVTAQLPYGAEAGS